MSEYFSHSLHHHLKEIVYFLFIIIHCLLHLVRIQLHHKGKHFCFYFFYCSTPSLEHIFRTFALPQSLAWNALSPDSPKASFHLNQISGPMCLPQAFFDPSLYLLPTLQSMKAGPLSALFIFVSSAPRIVPDK